MWPSVTSKLFGWRHRHGCHDGLAVGLAKCRLVIGKVGVLATGLAVSTQLYGRGNVAHIRDSGIAALDGTGTAGKTLHGYRHQQGKYEQNAHHAAKLDAKTKGTNTTQFTLT